MQATHFVPDEVHGIKGWRPPSSIRADQQFAEDVLAEKQWLLGEPVEETESIWHGVLHYTRKQSWVLVVWATEVFCLLFIFSVAGMEFWSSCPSEVGWIWGWAPVCQHCYSATFMVWDGVLIVMWFVHLLLTILLVSRGFSYQMRGQAQVDLKVNGIPEAAARLFFSLLIGLFLWLLIGVVLLITSNACVESKAAFTGNQRSHKLYSTTLTAVVGAPFLLFYGRLRL